MRHDRENHAPVDSVAAVAVAIGSAVAVAVDVRAAVAGVAEDLLVANLAGNLAG